MANKKTNIYGFTYIELIVSVFIIALMTGLFMVNYNNTNKRSQLGMIKQKLVSDIRLAQNYSLGSKTYNGLDTPSGGWGVHFKIDNPSEYIIFADKINNQVYNPPEAMETKILPAGITIDSLYTSSQGNVNTIDIVFFPPDPVTYVNNSTITNAQITLRENINNSTAVITVNSFGLIDAD